MGGKADVSAAVLDHSGLGRLVRRWGGWHGLLVLNHHRVADDPATVVDPGVWSATSDELDRQLRWLRGEFDLIGPAELDRLPPGRTDRLVLLTFDDGYLDTHRVALPVLESHGVAALFFLVSDLLDEPRAMWWDEVACLVRRAQRRLLPAGWGVPEQCLTRDRLDDVLSCFLCRARSLAPADREQFLTHLADITGTTRCGLCPVPETWITWDQARELLDRGHGLGGHSAHHSALSQLSAAEQAAEIELCRSRFEAETGRPMDTFAYPFGGRDAFGETTKRCLAAAGVKLGFSQYGGYNPPGRLDPYDIRRVAVERWASDTWLRSMMTVPAVFARTLAPRHGYQVKGLIDGFAVDLVRDLPRWRSLAGEWRGLARDSAAALSWEWLSQWWRVYGDRYGDGPDSLTIVTVRQDGRLVAALPLYRARAAGPFARPVLRFLSTGEAEDEETCADNLDLLGLPELAPRAARAALDLLADQVGRAELDLRGLAAESVLAAALAERVPGTVAGPQVEAFAADLTGGLDEFLARLSRKPRQNARNLYRKAIEAGLALSIAQTTDQAGKLFDELVALHQRRWTAAGQPGCFAAPRFLEFHRALAGSLAPWSEVVLAALRDGEQPLAVLYGFRHGATVELYQTGVLLDEESPVRSPGLAAHLLLIEALTADGVNRLDFLRGRSGLKDRLATESRPLLALKARLGRMPAVRSE